MILKKVTTIKPIYGTIHIGDRYPPNPQKIEFRFLGITICSTFVSFFTKNEETACKTTQYIFGIPVYTKILCVGDLPECIQ
jgi:hypothetical protein